MKWGHFNMTKSIFKMLLVSWSENMSIEEVWSFLKEMLSFFIGKGLRSCDLSNFEDDPIVLVWFNSRYKLLLTNSLTKRLVVFSRLILPFQSDPVPIICYVFIFGNCIPFNCFQSSLDKIIFRFEFRCK